MDINNYSYTPYFCEGETEPKKHKDKYYLWRLHDVRVISLDICCDMIPGYKAAALDTKNYIYDIVQAKVKTLI